MHLTPAIVPLPDAEDDGGRVAGEVLWVDRYGNCQLNIAPEQLAEAGADVGRRRWRSRCRTRPAAQTGRGRVGCGAFADAKPSELVVLVDSYGM